MLANLITPFRPTGPRVWYGIVLGGTVWWSFVYIWKHKVQFVLYKMVFLGYIMVGGSMVYYSWNDAV